MIYRKEIDGLRALAVLPVILFHAGFEIFSGGYIGVDVFFVISGFLITSILISEIKTNTFSITNFYERRARRLLPALFFMMVITLLFAWRWMPTENMVSFSKSLIAVSTFLSNILFWSESGYFDTASELKPLLHTWSLAVEEQYYILFPLILGFVYKLSVRWTIRVLVLLSILSFCLAQYFVRNDPTLAFYLLPTRAWELLFGSLAAIFIDNKDYYFRKYHYLVSLIGLIMLGLSYCFFNKNTPTPSSYTLIPVIGTTLILIFANANNMAGKILSFKPFIWIGLISYSLYLWHQPIFSFARLISLETLSIYKVFFLLLLTLIISYLSWRYVEKPFRNKGTFNKKTIFIGGLLTSFVFISFGIYGVLNSGFNTSRMIKESRIKSQIKKIEDERFYAIKSDICHFNNRTKVGVDSFLNNWKCKESKIGLKKVPLAVTGDSHSADLVVSLKKNGYLPLQLGGAGCSLVPKLMSNDCKKIYKKLYDEIKTDKYYKNLMLVNHYQPEELSEESVRELCEFWKKYNVNIYIVVGMPNFLFFKEKLSKNILVKNNSTISGLSKKNEIMNIYKSYGFKIIDRDSLFCDINNCDYKDMNGDFLITDGHHMSVYGAKKFGERLINIPEIHNLLDQN